MLPEILNFIFGKIHEQNKRVKIKEAISAQIPSIKRQVRGKVVEVLKSNSESMIKAISDKFDAELSRKQTEIEEVMQNAQTFRPIKPSHTRADVLKVRDDVLFDVLKLTPCFRDVIRLRPEDQVLGLYDAVLALGRLLL